VRRVDREAERRHALTPREQVAPMPAERREEDAAGPHPQHGRDVLDQRRHAARDARLRVEAEELRHRTFVDAGERAELLRCERHEQVDRQHRRSDRARELGAALDPRARLGVEPVDAHERGGRPRDRRLRRHGEPFRRGARHLDGPRERPFAGHVLRHQRELDPAPAAELEPFA
jgi:hypothetical protein